MTHRWSLARRLTALFAAGTLVIVVVNALGGNWYLRKSVEREFNTQLIEELDSAEAYFTNTPHTREDFRKVAQRLQSGQGAPRAWRLWDPDTKEIWGDFGELKLFERVAPDPNLRDKTQEGPAGLRWRAKELPSRLVLALVIDGSGNLALLERFQLQSAARIAVSCLIAVAIAWLFLRRVSRLLRRVAEEVRSDHDAGEPLDLRDEGAPEEIYAVSTALQERLSKVRAETEQARLFTASLAHELRSPIQNLVGETEVALIAPRDAATYRRVLESHLQELRELGDAVDNLLTMVATRASESKILNEEFDLAEEAELRLSREQSRARLERVQLDVHRSGNTRLVGDREALLRALRNLAANAVEWSPPGARVEVLLEGRDGSVIVTVDDQGPGVPPDIRERIFEPFFTGPARKDGRVGYGLGLAIARAAVHNQGGEIEVGSSASGGARFRLVLPRRGTSRRRMPSPIAVESSSR